VWSILGIGVTVPVWAFVVGVAIVLGIAATRRLWRVPDDDTLDSGAERLPRAHVDEDNQFAEDRRAYPQEETDQEIDVSGLERDVLKRIAKADDAPLYMDTLKRSLGITNIRLQTVVDRLTALDLVQVDDEEEDEEPVLFLTARGRQFVLEKRLAR